MKKLLIRNLVLTFVCFLTACTTDKSSVAVIENNQSIYYGRKSKLRFVKIQEEQSVSDIAREYKVPIKEVTRLNGLNSHDIVRTGQTLKIPMGIYYLVKENDTLENIARIHDIDLKVLAQANSLSPASEIRAGDYIKIPETTSTFVETKEYQSVGFESSEVYNTEQPLESSGQSLETEEQQQTSNADQTSALNEPQQSGSSSQVLPTESYLDPKQAKVINESSIERKKKSAPKDLGALTAQKSVSVAPKSTKTAQFFKHKTPLNSPEFVWPVEGKVIKPYGNGNDGINIAANKGTPVKAASGGDVAYSGTQGGYGNLIILRHNNGYMSAYSHLDKILVKKGQIINKGAQIGTVGTSGNVLQTQPQLQFSIKKGNATINPNG